MSEKLRALSLILVLLCAPTPHALTADAVDNDRDKRIKAEAVSCICAYAKRLRSLPAAYTFDYEMITDDTASSPDLLAKNIQATQDAIRAGKPPPVMPSSVIGYLQIIDRSTFRADTNGNFFFSFKSRSQFRSTNGVIDEPQSGLCLETAWSDTAFQYLNNEINKLSVYSWSKEEMLNPKARANLGRNAMQHYDIDAPRYFPILAPLSFLTGKKNASQEYVYDPHLGRLIWSDIWNEDDFRQRCEQIIQNVVEINKDILAFQTRKNDAPQASLDNVSRRRGLWVYINRGQGQSCPRVLSWSITSSPAAQDAVGEKGIFYKIIPSDKGDIPIMERWARTFPLRNSARLIMAEKIPRVESGLFSIDPSSAKTIFDYRTKMSIEQ